MGTIYFRPQTEKTSLNRSPKKIYTGDYIYDLPFGEKVVKIGAIDPKISWLKLKKEEINTSKIYSPVGKFAPVGHGSLFVTQPDPIFS